LANIKSAIKRIRVTETKRLRNRPVRSALKTFVGKARKLVDSGQVDDAARAVVTAISALDKAASKGIIHRNNAARRKSRLMTRLNKQAAHLSANPGAAPLGSTVRTRHTRNTRNTRRPAAARSR
jgi:small subunit ribosomal protein S20